MRAAADPALVMAPRRVHSPLEYSAGTSPVYAAHGGSLRAALRPGVLRLIEKPFPENILLAALRQVLSQDG